MSKSKRAATSAKSERPSGGGSYVRQKDGKLKQLERTEPAEIRASLPADQLEDTDTTQDHPAAAGEPAADDQGA